MLSDKKNSRGDELRNFEYCASYCEENIWHLCQHERFADTATSVVLISNKQRTCSLFRQRAAVEPTEPVFWDYHVILLAQHNTLWQAWDFDTLIGMPVAIEEYLRQTFPSGSQLESRFAPQFRVIPGDEYVVRFTSDRSHMQDKNGNWLAPPPDWPTIKSADPITLAEFLAFDSNATNSYISITELESRFCA